MKEGIWQERAAKLTVFVLCAGLFLFCARWVLPILLPFFVAYLISLMIRPVAQKLHAWSGISAKVCAIALLLITLAGLLLFVWFAASRCIAEVRHLWYRLLENGDSILASIQKSTAWIPTDHPVFGGKLRELTEKIMEGAVSALTTGIPTLAGNLISALPAIMIGAVVTVVAAFYFCMENGAILSSALKIFPFSVQQKIPQWKARAKKLSFRYLRAYVYLLFLTFVLLFFGFTVLGVRYAFLLSVLVAVIDMLPILGVGTVLVPWGVVVLLQKNFYLGFGLLILYFAATVLRQVMEPRLIGKSLGIPPLLSLFASYAGFEAFGVLGMVLGPFFAVILKSLWEQADTLSVEK